MMPMDDLLAVPEHRRAGLEAVLARVRSAQSVALTTHVNADGDGAGSQAALAGWLLAEGKGVSITNPTQFPEHFRYMLPEGVALPAPGAELDAAARDADLLLVVDTGEPKRIGRVARAVEEERVAVLDHHPPSDGGIPGPGLRDPSACATGELVYDLFAVAGVSDWNHAMVQGLYAAIETDTGSFRFSNTTPRTHAIAAQLIHRGVDPEAVYRRLHATMTMEQIRMLRLALNELESDPDLPLTWITIPRTVTHDMGGTADDLDGIVDYARNVAGTEVAVVFRETSDGATKVSLRSNGRVDVNAIARTFGGGGHVKASGAVIGAPPAEARPRVLDAVRDAIRDELAPAGVGP